VPAFWCLRGALLNWLFALRKVLPVGGSFAAAPVAPAPPTATCVGFIPRGQSGVGFDTTEQMWHPSPIRSKQSNIEESAQTFGNTDAVLLE